MRIHAITRRALSSQPLVTKRFASAYRSPFAPKYASQPHFAGFTFDSTKAYLIQAAGVGGALGFFALFIFADVPRVREDITTKIPFIGDRFKREIAPEDNPF